MSDQIPLEVGPAPDQEQLTKGIVAGIKDSQFRPPYEVTDPFRTPPQYAESWMLCMRSGASDEASRPTYSVFYGMNYSVGKDGQYLKSRYSLDPDNCGAQTYHPYTGQLTLPSASPSPTPEVEPKKHGKHHQQTPAG
jgi:hypothetical protein